MTPKDGCLFPGRDKILIGLAQSRGMARDRNVVRRVGHNSGCKLALHQSLVSHSFQAVAAKNAMAAQLEDIAQFNERRIVDLRSWAKIRDPPLNFGALREVVEKIAENWCEP